LAREQAELAGQAVRVPAELAAWNPAADQQVTIVTSGSAASFVSFSASNKDEFNKFFLERYLEIFNAASSALSGGDPAVAIVSALSLVTPPPEPNRSSGQMTLDEFNILTELALADMNGLAEAAGRAAYSTAYKNTYDAVYRQYTSGVPAANQWRWEGNGFAGAWDGGLSPPMDRSNYSHAEHQTVYDAAGNAHVLTTYYQKNPHAENVWDYIVACEPDEDDRLDSAGRPVTGTPQAGLLQKGKITFDANGKIKDMEAQDLNPAASQSGQFGWVADAPNAAGYFTVGVKFKNAPAAQNIDLDMGARRIGGVWRLDGVGTTQYGGGSLTVDSRQDGYPQGGLSHIYVTEDGFITGVYSNKQEVALYQICITRFLNPWGLQKMGNNLFAVTRHSGPGVTTAPGEGGAAVVLGNFLEQSNVDTPTEIVNMIMTQRGFQANSKVVTTHDAMISTAIETKR
jgi:flagellar hook-basal body protein